MATLLLAPGKRADFAIWPTAGVSAAGAWGPVSALVPCAPMHPRDGCVEGRAMVRGGRIVSFDHDGVLRRHRELAAGLMA